VELPGLAWLSSGALPAPAALAVAAAGAVAIAALYLLRLRRRRMIVAFAPLWLGAAGDPRASRRAQRLRHWISLALALAILATLWLGAVDPQPPAIDRRGRSLVVLIDRSASMSATDEPGTRLGAARREAARLVGGLAPSDRALIASFADEAQAESGFEADPSRLTRAISAISTVSPGAAPADLPRALAFAGAILRGRPGPTIVLVSDGGFTDDARRAMPTDPDGRPLDVRYLPVGRRADNVGILSLAARRNLADPGAVETALVVQSFRPAPSRVGVEISSGGHLVDTIALALGPREQRRLLLPSLFAPDARVEARLRGGDDLSLDDQAVAVIPPLPRRRVLRVGGADLYLDGALLSLGRTVRIDRLPAADADRALARAGNYDLVIFDGVTPAAAPTRGRYLYFDPHGPGNPFAPPGAPHRVRDPVLDPASLRRDHPLLRQLDLADVNVAEADRLALGPGDVALAGSFGVPLILARAAPGLRIAALAFDPRRSDLPMRAAFPLLIANTLAWTAAAGQAALEEAAASASASASAPPLSPIAGGTTRDARESDTTPAAALTLGGRALARPDSPSRRGPARGATWALLLATALLFFDWVSYHRRWTT
jgi:hypothetical protein